MERVSITRRDGEEISITGAARVIVAVPNGRSRGRKVRLIIEHDGTAKITRVSKRSAKAIDNREKPGQ